jgi:biopolymer transport protein ExbD
LRQAVRGFDPRQGHWPVRNRPHDVTSFKERAMLYRVLSVLAVLAVVCMVSAPVLAADEATVEGTVVKAGDGKLTIADKDKKEHSCSVAKDAKITCDGKVCKLEDLKKDVKVKVTTEGKGDKAMATKIEGSTK